MRFLHAFGTDIGRKRQQNQDSGVARPDLGLFVVADGMGGHRGGEIASAMAVETIPGVVEEKLKGPAPNPHLILKDAIRAANNAIFERAQKDPKLQGMGTTTTALLFHEGKAIIGHVGDSRCYFFQSKACWQLTRDHSLVQEKLRAGIITRAQLKTDRMRNVITRSVGFEADLHVETYEMNANPMDVFLICSDGLSGLVEDPQIQEAIQKRVFDSPSDFEENPLEFQNTIQDLIAAANQNGGDDNITAILVGVQQF